MAPEAVCDYIVVGAGSAGCVLAARLSESGSNRVVLLEAGGKDDSFWIRVPLGYGLLFDDKRINWLYESAPEPGLGNARVFQPRGRVLGGTSSINGMVYVRGQREDFDEWATLGNVGWGFDDVLPYFRKSEHNSRGSSKYHGADGPLGVSDVARNDLADAFIAAGGDAGYALTDDFNGGVQEGFGYNQLTVHHGRRSSTADAFLRPALKRANLKLVSNAMVLGLVFENKRAVGVRYRQGNVERTIHATREIAVCAGSYGSPQLLQLSGVGPGELLRSLDVPVIAERPGVGRNLQDHFTIAMLYKCLQPVTINDEYNSPLRKLSMGLRYLLTKNGPMAANASFCGGYLRSTPEIGRPDLKFNLALWGRSGVGRSGERLGLLPFSSFTPSVVLLRPDSRGSVVAISPHADNHPEIRFNFLASDADQALSIKALRLLRDVLARPAMAPYLGKEIAPGGAVKTDADLLAAVRKRGRSNHHAAGTCKMGQDEQAVVDDRLRVHGVENLRVADASIMPTVVSGNTNAAVIMIAEKAAEMMTACN